MIFRTVLIVLAAFVLFALVNYYNNKQSSLKTEKFFQANSQASAPSAPRYTETFDDAPVDTIKQASSVSPAEPLQNEDYRSVDYQGQKLPNDCFPKDRLSVDDLLPKDAANSKWAQVNPMGQGDISGKNFLNAGALIGVNTVGQSLRNANQQLRSEPPNPQTQVSIWMQSTIEPDLQRRPLEGF